MERAAVSLAPRLRRPPPSDRLDSTKKKEKEEKKKKKKWKRKKKNRIRERPQKKNNENEEREINAGRPLFLILFHLFIHSFIYLFIYFLALDVLWPALLRELARLNIYRPTQPKATETFFFLG